MKNRIVWQYYLLSCLSNIGGMAIISAVYVNFLLHNGLNYFAVNLINAVFFLTLFICEIPTGAFADIFGRKTSFVLACAMSSISLFVYGSSHTIWGFILAEILAAISRTFENGAFQAWLVDSLKHHGDDGAQTKVFANVNILTKVSGSLGAIAGAYLAVKNIALPWFVGGTMMIAVTILAQLIMKEEYFVRKTFSWRQGFSSMREVAISSVHYGLHHHAVRFILIITCLQIFAVQPLNMYWQPFFGGRGVAEAHFGFLYTGITISLALGAILIRHLKTKDQAYLLKSQALTGLAVIGIALIPGLWPALIFFFLHEVGRGCWKPLADGYLHQRIPSDERATIASFCAIAPHIGGAIGLVISGALAQWCGIGFSWIVSGIALLLGAVLVAKNGNHSSG